MEVAWNIICSVALLFTMMIPGVLMKKCKLSVDGLGKGISNLVLYIAQPALIFLAYVRPFAREILVNAIYVLVFSIIVHGIFSVVALMSYKKAPDRMRRMLRFATIFSNAAFMGIPLIKSVLGAEATIYASIYNIVFNLFVWSLGVYICTGNGDKSVTENDGEEIKVNISPLKVLYHPVTVAAILGIVFFMLPIENYIPKLVMEALENLGNLVAPLSMIIIGLRLAEMDVRGILKDKHMYLFLALRHFVLPLIALGLVNLVGLLLPVSNLVKMVIVILAATPTATSTTMFAEKYDCDATYASRLVAISTLISIVTMPIILLFA